MSELAFISGDRNCSIFVLKSSLFVNFNYCSPERLTFLGDVPCVVCMFVFLLY